MPIAGAVGAAPLYTDVLACRPPDEAEALPRLAQPTPEAARWLGDEWPPVELRGAGAQIRYLALAGSSIERPITLRTRAGGGEVTVIAPERWLRFMPVAGTALSCGWEGAAYPRYSSNPPIRGPTRSHGNLIH